MLRFCRQIYCLLQIALYIIFGIIWLNRGHHKFSKIIWSTSKRLFNLFVGLLDRLNCQKIVMKNMWSFIEQFVLELAWPYRSSDQSQRQQTSIEQIFDPNARLADPNIRSFLSPKLNQKFIEYIQFTEDIYVVNAYVKQLRFPWQ